MIAREYLGKFFLSATLIGSGGCLWADTIPANYSYVIKKANGATLLTIPLGHTLAGFTEVLGNIEEVSTKLLSNYNIVKIVETGEIKLKTAEDQVLIIGRLKTNLRILYPNSTSQVGCLNFQTIKFSYNNSCISV